jgi:predicted transcriptional regulator
MTNEKIKVVKIGIMPFEAFKKRTIAIAKGKYKPKKNEPKIWFNSIKSLANILSEENQELLKLIVEIHPQSIKELENVTGRKANNLLRTLRTMERYGFVKLIEGKSNRGRAPLIPEVIYNAAEIEMCFV